MRTHSKRPRIGRFALTLIGAAALGAPASASANVYTDTPDFNLSESTATYGSFFATSSSGVQYRWLDAPSKSNYISSANCYNNSPYGEAGYPAGWTSYQVIGYLPNGYCFNLRGRTAAGSGSMYYYDGRLFR